MTEKASVGGVSYVSPINRTVRSSAVKGLLRDDRPFQYGNRMKTDRPFLPGGAALYPIIPSAFCKNARRRSL